jgi:hypothetical protein
MLKKIKCSNIGETRLHAQELKKALRLVRTTIEEIEFDGKFTDNYKISGGIGPFIDFPNLKKISTDVESLIPQPRRCPKNFSLLELLPPNLESLHLTDAGEFFFGTNYRPFGTVNQFPNSNSDLGPMWTFYQLLEDVALAKERGPLKKLTSMSMEFDWGFRNCTFSEEDFKGVAAICKSLGIEWQHKVRKFEQQNVSWISPRRPKSSERWLSWSLPSDL